MCHRAIFAGHSVVLVTSDVWHVGISWVSENAIVGFSPERSCNDVVFWTTSGGIVSFIYISQPKVFRLYVKLSSPNKPVSVCNAFSDFHKQQLKWSSCRIWLAVPTDLYRTWVEFHRFHVHLSLSTCIHSCLLFTLVLALTAWVSQALAPYSKPSIDACV